MPVFVCFFASQGTVATTTNVRKDLGEVARLIQFAVELVDNENDLLECHEKASQCVQRVENRGFGKECVVVDYTGGTKNMSVALALAAIDKGFCFSYVGGDRRTKDGVGIVETGHDSVYANLNPWDFLAYKERRQASILFNSCQFKACHEIMSQLAEQTGKRKSVYRKLAFIVDAFNHWDLFRHTDALELFTKGKLSELCDDVDPAVAAFAASCTVMPSILKAIITSSKRGKIPCGELICDLYANAERRYREGKTDDAVLRLYRMVEMMAQDKLCHTYGIDTGNVALEKLPEGISDEYQQKYRASKGGRIQIPQKAAYLLLKELGDPLGASYDVYQKQFCDVQSSRNESYLAHGFKSSQDAVYRKLRDFVGNLGCIDPSTVLQFPLLNL